MPLQLDGPALAQRARSADRRRGVDSDREACSPGNGAMPSTVARWLEDEAAQCNAAGAGAALRRVGDVVARGQAQAPARRACSRCRTGSTCITSCRSRPSSGDGVTMLRLPEDDWRRARRLCADRPRHRPRRRARPGELLHLVPQPGQGQLLDGPQEKDGSFKKSVFGVTLAGCPLEEKISEMNLVKARGNSLGALAIVAVDNPLCAATGHRICNDCMKACIYQRQDPVDIPQIETRTLKDVLGLPWGFEIYSLLTRWNPLNLRRPLPRPATGYKVLVVGLGPGGFHPRAPPDERRPFRRGDRRAEDRAAAARDRRGRARRHARAVRADPRRREPRRAARRPRHGGVRRGRRIRHHRALGQEFPEDHPPAAGAPGAASRCMAASALAARSRSTSAFDLGFDHVALCAGAGRPTVIPMKNGLAPGVRQASDFLMALQLTGAAKTDSIANLTVRLPVVVIGGGLTAIDTATESLAYYPVQVEKFLSRYETLVAERGEEAVRAEWNAGRARGRRRVHRPCPRDPRRARGGAARRPRAAPREADRRLGRGDDRLSPAPDRLAELHPQPRGGGEGDGGGHPLCRDC